MEKKRAAPIIIAQKDMLIEFMAKHPELDSGKFSTAFTFKKARQLWQNISEELNSVAGGGKKEWRQWRKTWQDLKKKTKEKMSKEKKHAGGTGGGKPIEIELDSNDLKMLDLLSPVSISGQQNVPESVVVFNFEDTMADIDPTPSAAVGDIENETLEENEATEKENCEPIATPKVQLPRKTPKLTASTRLQKSLLLSQQLIKRLDEKKEVLNGFYETKKIYLDHRMKYESEKLKAIKQKNDILLNIEKHITTFLNK